ncbi:MAG: GNAT family N-acetyltransferase [Longicatena sp.]
MKDHKLYIRQALDSDVEEIEELYRARVLYNDAHQMHQWNLEDVTWEELSKLYTISDCYVGIYDGHIASAMMLVDEDVLYWPSALKGESLYLHKLCVHPMDAGKGFADQMIVYFKEVGKQKGYPQVKLDVREHKKKLREMYERNGFLLVSVIDVHKDFLTALYQFQFASTTSNRTIL